MEDPCPSLSNYDVAPGDDRTRVLLAEDDPAFRTTMSLILGGDGYEVVEVADGSGVLDELVHSLSDESSLRSFGVIITDVRMPGF